MITAMIFDQNKYKYGLQDLEHLPAFPSFLIASNTTSYTTVWETLPVLAGNRKLLVCCLGRVLLPETIILCGAQTVHQVTVKIKTILQFKRLFSVS